MPSKCLSATKVECAGFQPYGICKEYDKSLFASSERYENYLPAMAAAMVLPISAGLSTT